MLALKLKAHLIDKLIIFKYIMIKLNPLLKRGFLFIHLDLVVQTLIYLNY